MDYLTLTAFDSAFWMLVTIILVPGAWHYHWFGSMALKERKEIMKKKRIVPMIILLAVVAVLLICYFLLKNYNREQEKKEEAAAENDVVISFAEDDIKIFLF